LAALAAEGILGRTLEEVVIHLTRNALHRDWVPRPETPEKARTSNARADIDCNPRMTGPTSDQGYPAGKRLFRLPEVAHLIGLSKSTIYGMVNLGTFPAPKRLGGRSVAWLQSDVVSWIDARNQSSQEPTWTAYGGQVRGRSGESKKGAPEQLEENGTPQAVRTSQ
jgi:prophage regulatory protein